MSQESNLARLDHIKSLADSNLSPEDWVARFATLHGLKYHYKTNGFEEDGEIVETSLILSRMRVLAHDLSNSQLKGLFPDAIAIWKKKQEKAFLTQLRKRFSYSSSSTDEVSKWVEAATGKVSELDISVLSHFIWQVKRKLFGLSVDHHLMPVLVGRSGGGKSVAIRALLAPLEEVCINRDMTVFNDAFGRRQFARNYIMFLDEMGKSDKADVNALKNIITAKTIDWRGMNSESTCSGRQNCTFIAASNHPVRDRIQDPTSARRFWQLNCAPKLDWEKVNSIDYVTLWKSVDENGPCPILSCLEQIQAVQSNEIRSRDIIEQWLETSCEPVDLGPESPTTEELYGAFKAWCLWQNNKTFPGVQGFARALKLRLETLDWPSTSRHSHRGTCWPLRVNPLKPKSEAVSVIALRPESTEDQKE